VAPMQQTEVSIDMFTFAMSEKRLQGTVFGSCAPRNDVPMLLDLYMDGKLKLDELITKRYGLDDINEGFQDMREGRVIRALIEYDR